MKLMVKHYTKVTKLLQEHVYITKQLHAKFHDVWLIKQAYRNYIS
jgi:hypothetical protein